MCYLNLLRADSGIEEDSLVPDSILTSSSVLHVFLFWSRLDLALEQGERNGRY